MYTYVHYRHIYDGETEYTQPFFVLSSKDTEKKKNKKQDDKYIPTLGVYNLLGDKKKKNKYIVQQDNAEEKSRANDG